MQWTNQFQLHNAKHIATSQVVNTLASPRGAWGCNCSPSVPRMGREIRANPMSFFGGYPSCGGLALFIEGPFFLLHAMFVFFSKMQIVLYTVFSETKRIHMFSASPIWSGGLK